MNYPMKDGRIDPDFVEKISAKTDWMRHYEIEKVILAAQEVMQESEEINVGDSVQWRGVEGRVTAKREDGEYFYVDFEDGVKSGMYKRHLTKIEEAQHGEG